MSGPFFPQKLVHERVTAKQHKLTLNDFRPVTEDEWRHVRPIMALTAQYIREFGWDQNRPLKWNIRDKESWDPYDNSPRGVVAWLNRAAIRSPNEGSSWLMHAAVAAFADAVGVVQTELGEELYRWDAAPERTKEEVLAILDRLAKPEEES